MTSNETSPDQAVEAVARAICCPDGCENTPETCCWEVSTYEAIAAIAAIPTPPPADHTDLIARLTLARVNRAANALLASDVECMTAAFERVVREIAALSEAVVMETVDAESIVNSDPVIRTYASCEWDDLHTDGKLWIEAIVRETEARALQAHASPRELRS